MKKTTRTTHSIYVIHAPLIQKTICIFCVIMMACTSVFHSRGNNLLHQFVMSNDLQQVQILLSSQIDVNAKDERGRTALMIVTDVKMAKELVAANADVNAKDENGESALSLAVFRGNVELVKILLATNVEINAKSTVGDYGMLMRTEVPEYVNSMAALRAAGAIKEVGIVPAVPLSPLNGGSTALMYAARNADVEIVKLLLDAGADPEMTNAVGKSARFYATIEKEKAGQRPRVPQPLPYEKLDDDQKQIIDMFDAMKNGK